MSESFPDKQETVDATYLWSYLQLLFTLHENTSGVEMLKTETYGHVVLRTQPTGSDAITVWGKLDYMLGITEFSLTYEDLPSGTVYQQYDIHPDSIVQFAQAPTRLDAHDLREIQLELGEAVWDRAESEKFAETYRVF